VFCTSHVTRHRTGVASWTSFNSRTVRGNLDKSHVLVGQTFFPHLTTPNFCSFMRVFAPENFLEPARGHLHVLVNYLSSIFVKATFARSVVATLNIRTCVCLRSSFLYEDLFFWRVLPRTALWEELFVGTFYVWHDFRFAVKCSSRIYTEKFLGGFEFVPCRSGKKFLWNWTQPFWSLKRAYRTQLQTCIICRFYPEKFIFLWCVFVYKDAEGK